MTEERFKSLVHEVRLWKYSSPLSECLSFALSQKRWETEHHGENTVLLKRRSSEHRVVVSAGCPSSNFRYYGYAPEITFRTNSLPELRDWLEKLYV